MTKENLSLKHHDLFYNRLKKINAPFSEFSFANLYLFRDVHAYCMHIEQDCRLITGLTSDEKQFVFPLCLYEDETPDLKYIKNLLKKYKILFPISEEQLKIFPESDFIVSDCSNDSDYIFKTEKMASYSGRKLHKKRNLLKQFLEQYSATQTRLTRENINDAKIILENWVQPFTRKKINSDYSACLEALEMITELKLEGIIYCIEEKPAGFILGEGLTDKIFALHFTKGLTRYKGIYQYMYNNFASTISKHFNFINFEQDLGLQSLRQAKSSYYPDRMAHKCRVSLK